MHSISAKIVLLAGVKSPLRTSWGKARCTAPGLPVVATRKACRIVSGIYSVCFKKLDHLVTGSKSL